MKLERLNKKELGATVSELLVSVLVFGLVSTSIASYATNIFTSLGLENRASASSRELRNAISLLSSELRMGASVSPYLPGEDPSLVHCQSQTIATGTTIRFLVVHDDPSVIPGIQPYYVGYSYNSSTNQLYRGEVPGVTVTSCALPTEDPLSESYARVVAERVYPYDSNGDGIAEPIFAYNSGTLTINLAVEVEAPNGESRTQGISTRIYTRTL